jgi:hypothetical protein
VLLLALGWLIWHPLAAHIDGPPTHECTLELPGAHDCLTQDHTFLQGRSLYQRARGQLPAATCRALQAQPPLTDDTPAPSGCRLDRPANWGRVPCPAGSDGDGAVCVSCFYLTTTTDPDLWRLTLARDCATALIEHGSGEMGNDQKLDEMARTK